MFFLLWALASHNFWTFQEVRGLSQTPASQQPKVLKYELLATYPHDKGAFTQGLELIDDKYLLESTGTYGKSSLRIVRLKDGTVEHSLPLEQRLFGEGVTRLKGEIFQLTWREGVLLKFKEKRGKLEKVGEKTLPGEGWGIAAGGGKLFVSDGSTRIRVLDPQSLKEERSFVVHTGAQTFDRLNELEYVQGEIFANMWGSDLVVRFAAADGLVTGILDLQGLKPKEPLPSDAVLNGIAYAGKPQIFYVTGKLWPQLFKIRIYE